MIIIIHLKLGGLPAVENHLYLFLVTLLIRLIQICVKMKHEYLILLIIGRIKMIIYEEEKFDCQHLLVVGIYQKRL